MGAGGYWSSLRRAGSRVVNAMMGGASGEMLAARAHRKAGGSVFWHWVEVKLDDLFFWEHAHCRETYEFEMQGLDRPDDYH